MPQLTSIIGKPVAKPRLEQQLAAANERAANELKIERNEHNDAKKELKTVRTELVQVRNQLAAVIFARSSEQQQAKAVEKRLKQENATLKIDNKKRKLIELHQQKMYTTEKKRKREIDSEISAEEWRLDDLVDGASEE